VKTWATQEQGQSGTRLVLVCFAVKEEAAVFQRLAAAKPRIRILLTGIGSRRAETTVRAALAHERPGLVLTSGFAGGLRPELAAGTVVFAAEEATALGSALLAAGARPGRFHCVGRVAVTAQEKGVLRQETGADAVEMESQFIRAVCAEQGIPSATVRVILDAAGEDLPLDFNQFMTGEPRLNGYKLGLALLKSPGKIRALRRLQRQSAAAAKRLGEVLARVLLA
jgi:adenosylhomocysteine nucleosidase